MKNYTALLLRLLLTLIVIYSFGSLLATGSKYIGKDFFDSSGYQENKDEFVSKLEYYVLNPSDKDASINAIDVSEDEINYYRNYYGTEAEQIYSIEQQYETKIAEASNVQNPNTAYIESLQKERDTKITEIQKNFTDDQVVKDKITEIKTEILNRYFAEYEKGKANFLSEFDHFGYELKNATTSEKLQSHENESAIKKFDVKIHSTANNRDIDMSNYDYNEGLANGILKVVAPNDMYTGKVLLISSYLDSGGISWEYKGFTISKWLHYALWLVGVVALILLLTKFKWSNELFEPVQYYVEKTKQYPIDVHAVVLFIIGLFTLSTFDSESNLISRIAYSSYNVLSLTSIIGYIFSFLFKLAILATTIFLAYSFVKRVQQQSKEDLWETSFTSRFVDVLKDLFLNRSIGMQTVFMFFVFYLGGFGLFIGLQDGELFAFYLFLFVFILVPVLYIYLSRMGYLNKIMKQTEKMANGELTKPIKVKGKSPLAKHAQNLNALQEGVKSSVTAQAKSERLKTELITNVSHDLRTPLTSIITYTDLLKNPDLTEGEREKYVSILDKKADRLKVLIEDLFEVSKMASGNIELVKQKVDVAQLIQQITGEHTSDFEEQKLDLRIDIQTKPIYAYVDGQKLWRVFENLLNNAKKYSMTGTRVYVTLTETNNHAVLTIKNVSKYELSGDATELTERFKRADLARHTEGSGLGLAIATSIVHLHGGTLDITADGDLFKVTVELPC